MMNMYSTSNPERTTDVVCNGIFKVSRRLCDWLIALIHLCRFIRRSLKFVYIVLTYMEQCTLKCYDVHIIYVHVTSKVFLLRGYYVSFDS